MLVSLFFSVWLRACYLTMMSIVLFICGPRMVRHTSQMVRRTETKICVVCLAHVCVCLVDQSCLILCNPVDCSPPGSSVHGILQARILEWVTISFSNAWKWKVKVKSLSHVRFLVTPWTAAHQAPLSMGFSRQEYWSGVPLPSLI